MIEARTIWFLRLAQLVAALVMAFVVLGLSGNILSKLDGFSPDYAGLSLATAVLTLVAVAPIMIIDFFRAGAISSFVVVEISWAGLLTILWLASAADTTAALGGTSCPPSKININTGFGIITQNVPFASLCHEQQALAAFGWLSFFNLLAWLVFLIVAASIAHSRGNSQVWFGPVTGTEFFAPAGRTEQSENAVEYAPQQQGYVAQQGYPSPAPQMQQQFTGGTMMDPQQQDPMAYPPNNGYNAGAPNQA